MENTKLPTVEQWEIILRALEDSAEAYWEDVMDSFDHMLDDTTLSLAEIVRDHFPEINEKCKQQAKERIDERNEARRIAWEEM